MSYCRWSSDDWKCDLYCYADVSGGFTTHVAGRRRSGDIPHDPFDDLVHGNMSSEEYIKEHNRIIEIVGNTPMVDIDLPHAGETFNDPDLKSFKERLLMLRNIGYNFPDYVIEEIDEEIKSTKS